MGIVTLTASGYTWLCPECGAENYTGAAPKQVDCERCQARFGVGDLRHRKDHSQQGQMVLFDSQDERPGRGERGQ